MPEIEIKNLRKIYKTVDKDVPALDDINLHIHKGDYNTILGPSGCGKTTLLRCIAGLIDPTSGQILFDGKDVSHTSVQDRHVGFVFQHFAIFPHLDVWHNVAYGPTIQGWSKEEIAESVTSNLKRVGLEDRPHAMPAELSGGMRQRLGLARALSTNSKLLLLDEPLSALDAKIGEFLRYELQRIVKKHGITAIHVTHNQQEAMTISDNIILMKQGRVVQSGTPEEVYEKPNSVFAANFVGKCNFFAGEKVGDYRVKCGDKVITVGKKIESPQVAIGVRPEKFHMESKSDKNFFSGKLEQINFMGHLYEYQIRSGENLIWAYKQFKEHHIKEKFKVDDLVSFWFSPEDCFVWKRPESMEKELAL
jgi:ABC-type Fe3+/spermidine/putrescine transport system ATPase subunit